VRDRMQFIADSISFTSHLSEPSDARGQAIGLLGQTLVQGVSAGGFGGAFIALGGMFLVALCGVLLFKYARRHASQPVDTVYPATARAVPMLAVPVGAVPLAAIDHWRPRRSVFAAMFRVAARHTPAGFAAILAIGLTAASASANPAGSPLGNWATANGHGVIEIAQCGDVLCGRIVGIDRKPTEPMPTDVDGRPQCGLTIISNERSQADGTWLGQVSDPRDGGVYQAKLWLDERGDLRLRGFIGLPILGSTQTWHRFTGHLSAACRLA
jgi:uncharacterized protein (DUF2147 family)